MRAGTSGTARLVVSVRDPFDSCDESRWDRYYREDVYRVHDRETGRLLGRTSFVGSQDYWSSASSGDLVAECVWYFETEPVKHQQHDEYRVAKDGTDHEWDACDSNSYPCYWASSAAAINSMMGTEHPFDEDKWKHESELDLSVPRRFVILMLTKQSE